MASVIQPIWCDECAVQITWTSLTIDGLPYCCHECAVGLECDCANINSRLEDEAGPFWVGTVEGGKETTYSIDYIFE